jgi:predicted GNAT family N-acyltransferase
MDGPSQEQRKFGPSIPIEDSHDTRNFSCGKEELDEWLQESALACTKMETARTFVWTNEGNEVLAFYALCAHLVVKESLSKKLAHGSPQNIPAILVAKLALDKSLQHRSQRFGGQLLVDAMKRVLVAANNVGTRLVVVDAIDEEAECFYQKYGFEKIQPGSSRLCRKISSIRADFAAAHRQ